MKLTLRQVYIKNHIINNSNIVSKDPSPLLADRYDYVFWFGDLNYRVNCSRAMADKLIEEKRIEVTFIYLTFFKL